MTNLRVVVFRRPDLIGVQENLYNLVGFGELKRLYKDEDYKSTKRLTLYYPERFLNIIELRDLVNRVRKAGYSHATIVTSSVYIIQTVHSEFIEIVQDECIQEKSGFILSNKESGLPIDSGLGVLNK